jgi:hypothetical protein
LDSNAARSMLWRGCRCKELGERKPDEIDGLSTEDAEKGKHNRSNYSW